MVAKVYLQEYGTFLSIPTSSKAGSRLNHRRFYRILLAGPQTLIYIRICFLWIDPLVYFLFLGVYTLSFLFLHLSLSIVFVSKSMFYDLIYSTLPV